MTERPEWGMLPQGAIVVEAGNSVGIQTGTWRTEVPLLDLDKCTHCMICWVFCPDDSILVEDRRVTGIDLFHCKGCGICAVECPVKAIVMEGERSDSSPLPVSHTVAEPVVK